MSDSGGKVSAESEFRAAFHRLINGRPILLAVGALVSQNNVAKEAGRDPSALRKNRYPDLIREIQEWITKNSKVDPKKDEILSLKRRVEELRARVVQLEKDRDLAQSLLIQAHDRIVILSRQNEKLSKELPVSNVIKL